MKAVVFSKNKKVDIKKVLNPQIEHPRDAIIKVTSAAICGSDLHMYDGRTGMEKGHIFGHEIMGVVDAIGDGISQLKKGDRVVLPFNISCGMCINCVKGETGGCLTTNPDGVGSAYGYAEMGPYEGGQAEYVRVPFADFNCLKLPGKPWDKFEDDFLMLADIFPTGYHACELAKVSPGKSVVIFGAGPVGLLATHSAFLRGAAQVFVVDPSKDRLKIAKKFGAETIHYSDGQAVKQIQEIRKKNKLMKDSLRPGEEKLLKGVDCGIDAVGYQATTFNGEKHDPTNVMRQLIELVNPGGHIGVIGVYTENDPGAKNKNQKKGIFEIPFGDIFSKALSIGTGQTPVKKYNAFLRDLIIAGIAHPSVIITDHIIIDKAPQFYEKFDFRGLGKGKGYTKIVIRMKENFEKRKIA